MICENCGRDITVPAYYMHVKACIKMPCRAILVEIVQAGELSLRQAAARFDVSHHTFKRWLEHYGLSWTGSDRAWVPDACAISLIERMFELAWLDIANGDEHARSAVEFVTSDDAASLVESATGCHPAAYHAQVDARLCEMGWTE